MVLVKLKLGCPDLDKSLCDLGKVKKTFPLMSTKYKMPL